MGMKKLAALCLLLSFASPLRAQTLGDAWKIVWMGNPAIQQLQPPSAADTPKKAEPAAARGPASLGDPGPLVLAINSERGETILGQVRQHSRVAGAMVVGVTDSGGDPRPDTIAALIDTAVGAGVTTFIIDGALVKGVVSEKISRLSSQGLKFTIAIPE